MDLFALAFWVIFIICVFFQFPFSKPYEQFSGWPVLVMLGLLGWKCIGH